MLQNPLKKISHQIFLSYTIPLAFLAVLCVSAYSSARSTFLIENRRDLLNESKDLSEDAGYRLMSAVGSVKDQILKPEGAQYYTDYQSSYDGFLIDIEELNRLADQQNDDELRALIRTVEEEGSRINAISQRMFLLVDDEDSQRAISLMTAVESDGIDLAKDALIAHLDSQLEINTANFVKAQTNFKYTLIGGSAIAIIGTLLVGWMLTRRIRHQMQKMVSVVEQNGIQVTTSSTQIAASSQQLAASVSEQAASTHQIAATTTEIAATAEELSHAIERVSDLSDSASQTAAQGKEDLEGMAVMIRQLTEATATISAKLGQIDDKANNINAVVTTITRVAEQTNLLSLNAAIEAEKAGEYGAGFSVVAREIRRLADQTAIATLDIENIVKDMASSVSAGVMEMDKFTKNVEESADGITELSTQMAQIIYQVQSLAPQFEAVSNGMSAQLQGAQQIRSAMEQLNDTSQQTADSVKDTNQVIGQLGDVAKDLQTEVAHFRLAV